MSACWTEAALPRDILYVIGVDGGGTSTRARIWSRSGAVLGEGKAGASGLMQGSVQAWRHIGQAIEQASTGTSWASASKPAPHNCALGLGLAGANNPQWHAECMAADPGYARLVLESDAVTALLGAHQGAPGALVILGTGAIGLGLGADGQRTTVGGWGFPSGDEGSGADLGLRAANLTQRAVDGRHALTPLTRAVLHAVGGSRTALLAWCGAARQFEYATLAPLVFEHETNDPAAAALVDMALHSMVALARALDPAHTLPLTVAGSIGQRLAPRLPTQVRSQLVTARGDAMDGAAALCFL